MKLYNDNCFNVLPKIKGDFIIITDPPFNIGYKYDSYKDRFKEDDYYIRLANLFDYTKKIVLIHYPEAICNICARTGRVPEKVVSWVYNSNTKRQHRDIAFFGIKPDFSKVKQPYKNPNDKRIKERIAEGKQGASLYDWWNINQVKNVSKNRLGLKHPCVMPLEVRENIIKILPNGNETIVDPFMGSGTTGVACLENKRDFIGVELSKEYYNEAKERLKI